MKNKTVVSLLVMVMFSILFAFPVSANSSWVWISETSPTDILPFAVAVTLIIECVAIRFIAEVKSMVRVLVAVILANLLSFAAPYFHTWLSGSGLTIAEIVEKVPFYTVGFIFLFMTLVCELPIVYNLLKKQTDNRKKLAITIVVVNIVTTVLTAVAERTLCYGKW